MIHKIWRSKRPEIMTSIWFNNKKKSSPPVNHRLLVGLIKFFMYFLFYKYIRTNIIFTVCGNRCSNVTLKKKKKNYEKSSLCYLCYKFDKLCHRTHSWIRTWWVIYSWVYSFNLSEAGEPQKRIRCRFLSRSHRPQPLPKSNKDHESRFLRNSRSDLHAFPPTLLLRDIKGDEREKSRGWPACEEIIAVERKNLIEIEKERERLFFWKIIYFRTIK